MSDDESGDDDIFWSRIIKQAVKAAKTQQIKKHTISASMMI